MAATVVSVGGTHDRRRPRAHRRRRLSALADTAITDRLRPLHDVGIGHLTLGRPLGTLSGGERQRLKIAGRLGERTAVLVLDEPTTGLRPTDVDGLLALLNRLVDAGNTVIAVEHDLDLVRHADWIIDLGPDAGRHGGRILFEGTPEQLCSTQDSHTAERLRRATAD